LVDGLTDEMVMRALVRIADHVVLRAFEQETVLLNLHTGMYHGLNQTGGRMVELLMETGSVPSTAAAISREMSHPVEDVERDLTQLCVELVERGLIELDEPTSA
jgi:hypothetical protein